MSYYSLKNGKIDFVLRWEEIMQNKSRKSKEINFIELLNFIADPAVIVDEKGRFRVINDAFENLTGLSKKKLIGVTFLDVSLLTAESKAVLLKNLMKRMQGLPVEPYEISFTDKAGQTRYTEVKAKKIAYAGHPVDLVIFRDITRRKKNLAKLKEYSERMEALVAEKVEEIKESEEKFRAISTCAKDAIVAVGSGSEIVYWNPAAERIFGYSQEEAAGKNILNLIISPRDRGFHQIFAQQVQKRQPPQKEMMEFIALRKDGTEFPAELSAALMNFKNKSCLLVIVRDVSERRMAEKKIGESEENFRTIFENAHDMIAYVDTRGKILDVNDKVEKFLGYKRDEVIGKNFTKLGVLTLKDIPKILKLFADALRKGATERTVELELKHRNGSKVFLDVGTSFVRKSGKIVGFVNIFRDITERRENEKALRDSEERFKQVAENALEWIWEVDSNGLYTYASPVVEKILGYKPDEIVGKKHFYDLFHPEEREELKRAAFQVFAKKSPIRDFLNQNVHKNGSQVWLSTSGVPVVDEKGRLLGYRGADTDITERKKSEEALRKSEEKYRELINGMNDTAWVIGLDGMFIDVNDAAVKVLGYSREELLRMRPSDIDNSLTKEQIRDLIKGMPADQIQVFETAHTTKDGKTIPVEISSSLVTYQGKQAILSIARNITERKQAQQGLTDSEEKFRAISTYASEAIILLDKTDQVVYWNLAAERIFGYTKEEAIGKKLNSLIVPPENHEPHLEMLNKLFKNKAQISEKRTEITALRKDGTEFPIELSATALSLKGTQYVLEIIRDVSERKKMEAELKQERDMLEAITENVGAGLAIISKDYHILWANKLLNQLNGNCEGKTCYSTFNKLTCICPDCGAKKVFENGVSIDVHEYVTKDDKGNTVWVELIVTPIKDEEGNVVAALELAVNITERKIMQNKLAEYSQKLEKLVEQRTEQLKQTQAKLVKSERLATIGELAAMVGHDLRNPLTGIAGAAYYLKAKHGTDVGAKGKEMLETIEKAISHSNKIINDLLEYSRDLKLKFTETSPKAMLQSTSSLLEVPEKIQIVDATKDKPMVKADTEKIHIVFVKIIQNAIDAMPEGGTLTVKSRKVKDTLEIAFKDTGTGMSKEILSKLKGGFPLFTTKAKGMGFGLPICKRIVEAHGGKLSVESTHGKGTTVTVTIPVNPEPVDEGEEKWIFNESMLSAITTAQRAP